MNKNLLKIKNVYDLKYYHELFAEKYYKRKSYYFTKDTMKFFGDTMSNYKIKLGKDYIELHRKKAVKHNNQSIAYFNYNDFQHAVI